MADDLRPLDPDKALSMWLDRQRAEKSEETVQSYFYRVRQFVEWLDDEGMNATPEVIRTHYDKPDLLKRMESRRSYME